MVKCVEPLFVDMVHSFMQNLGFGPMSFQKRAQSCTLTPGEQIPLCLYDSGTSISASGFGFIGSIPVPSNYYDRVTYPNKK